MCLCITLSLVLVFEPHPEVPQDLVLVAFRESHVVERVEPGSVCAKQATFLLYYLSLSYVLIPIKSRALLVIKNNTMMK